MIYRSFGEWQELGYQVIKGERSTRRSLSTGSPLFSSEQVKPKAYRSARLRDTCTIPDDEEMEAYDRAEGWYDWDNMGDR